MTSIQLAYVRPCTYYRQMYNDVYLYMCGMILFLYQLSVEEPSDFLDG